MVLAAAVTVFAVAADNDGEEAAGSTSPTSASGGTARAPGAPPADGATSPSDSAGATSPPDTDGDLPPAPWRVAAVPRPDVPPDYVAAWDRAANRAGCTLLFPLDGGPPLAGAEATEERTPEDRGWDIFLTGAAGTVEILGLFDKSAPTDRPPGAPSFTRRWADGSVARYGPDIGNVPAGTADPDTSPFEAVLTLPDQSCAYRLYDTLGKAHLESVFDRLRLMAP